LVYANINVDGEVNLSWFMEYVY